MLSRNQRVRLLLLLAVAQTACLAVGLWIHHCLVHSGVHRAAEQKASDQLAESADELLMAVSGLGGPERSGEPISPEVVGKFFRTQHAPSGVRWVLVDPQWQVLATLGIPEAGSPDPLATGEELAWLRPPDERGNNVSRISGTLLVGGREHVAVASPLKNYQGYVVAHRSLESAKLEPSVLVGSLPVAGAITWAWTAALLGIVVYLVFSRLYDQLSERHSRAEAEALRRIQSLVRTRDALIFGLASLAESRDEVTGRHVERVSFYASRLAAAASHHPKFRDAVTPEFVRGIAISSVLHDIGKVGIEDSILFKPGRLTDTERARMQKHSTIGGRYLADVEQRLGASPVIHMAWEIALWHHERWDGTGYPEGLAGEEIPLAARIAAVADVYEALASPRPYKPAFPHQRCVEMIRNEAGKQFDPDLVEVFLQVETSFRQIAYQYGEHRFQEADSESPGRESGRKVEPAGLPPGMEVVDELSTIPATPACMP